MLRWTYRAAQSDIWCGTFTIVYVDGNGNELPGHNPPIAVGMSEENAKLVCALRNAWVELEKLVKVST